MIDNENMTKKEEHNNTSQEPEYQMDAGAHDLVKRLMQNVAPTLDPMEAAFLKDNIQVTVSRTEKPHSYSWRYGGAGTDGKIYYETPEELATHFEQLATVQERIAAAVRRIKTAHMEDKE